MSPAKSINNGECQYGDGNVAHRQGMCQWHYNRKREAVRNGEIDSLSSEWEAPSKPARVEPAHPKYEPPVLTVDPKASPGNRPMTPTEVDDLIARASAGDLAMVPDLQQPEGTVSEGANRLLDHLRSNWRVLRRKLIRRMLDSGLDDLEIVAAFAMEPDLRSRWVDNVKDPLSVLKRDLDTIRREKKSTRRTREAALDAYMEEIRMLLRASRDIARDPKVPKQAKNDALNRIEKLSQQLAVMEGAVRVVPGQGVMPAASIGVSPPAAPDKPKKTGGKEDFSDDDDTEDFGDEFTEEDNPFGAFEVDYEDDIEEEPE